MLMENRTTEVYVRTIAKEFRFLKDTASLEDLFTKGVALDSAAGIALPLTILQSDDPALADTLRDWQDEALVASAGADLAQEWIHLSLDDTTRLAYLLLNKYGHRVGILEFAADVTKAGSLTVSFLAGVDTALIGEALRALCLWAKNSLGANEISIQSTATSQNRGELFAQAGFVATDARLTFAPDHDQPGNKMILTAGPSISAREANYAYRAAKYGWNTQWSGYLNAFERSFSAYVGAQYCLATSSCTGALHIALTALGIGPGDEVIVPDVTWVASANAVRYVGAKPVFADIEEDSWCLDPVSFDRAITPRTKAVIPVHLYGHPARMDKIVAIARQRGLFVVEDAAPAIGAEWQGKRTGSFGDFACFSFQGAKLLVTGEGGALVTNDSRLHEKAMKIWDQGRDPAKTFWIDAHGLKYKMSNIQAALGLAQLERCDEQIEMKRRIFEWYNQGLQECPYLTLQREVAEARSIYWMSNCRVASSAPIAREELRAAMKARNVDTRPVFPAISQYPIWGYTVQPQPVARQVGEQGINLPSGVSLSEAQVTYTCRVIRELLDKP